jgi:hypothetical protein
MPDNYLTGMAAPTSVPGQTGQYAGRSAEQIIGLMRRNGWTQEGVNAVYALRGLSNPPQIGALEGQALFRGRGGALVGPNGRMVRPTGDVSEIVRTLDLITQQAVDPFSQRSGISNLAGGLLNGVGSYVGGPVWTAFTGIADAGNRALGNDDGTSYTDGRRSGADRVGAAIGAIAGMTGAPGSYGANNPSTDPTGGAPGTQGGPTTSGGGSTGGFGMPGSTSMNWGDWVNLFGQLAGSYFQGQGARDASDASVAGIREGIAEQRRQFDLSRSDQLPWMQAGTAALGRLQDPTAFTKSPDYDFVLGEQLRGVENSAAARGGLFSGNTGRALQERAANVASGEYGNWFNRNAALAGLGQTSAQSLGTLGQNNANNVSNLLNQQGNARASGIEGQTNALTGGISDFLSWYNRRRGG